MTILIDADGCPVVDLTLRSAGKKGVPAIHPIVSSGKGHRRWYLTKALTVWILHSSTG